jgi:hypothetical protein
VKSVPCSRRSARATVALVGEGYTWDVFVSYPRVAPIGPWVIDRFVPILETWLNAALPARPKIFVDQQMEVGGHWPSMLADSLRRSKVMVAIWAPPYFGSKWCMSEWHSMRAREQALGPQAPTLVYPLRFFDGETFPAEAKAIQCEDYTSFNRFPPGKTRPRSRLWNDFEQRIQTLSLNLSTRLATAPVWDSAWPLLHSPDPQFDTSLSFDQVSFRKVER